MSKKHEEKFSLIDLFKGGIPNPASYPIPVPPSDSAKNVPHVAEKSVRYKASCKTEKK